MSIDETLTYIDNQISNVISGIINARAKHLDAINKILEKIKSIQEAASLDYRLGTTYDKMVKVETPTATQFDVERPRYRLQYVGAKMGLQYNGEGIMVPSVPIFIFEPTDVPQNIHEIGEELLARNLLICFPRDVEFVEEPDIENAFAKYYRFDTVERAIGCPPLAFLTVKRIPLPEPVLAMSSYEFEEGTIYNRKLHINATEYSFTIGVYPGRAVGDLETVGGILVSDVKIDSILFYCTTDYPEQATWCIFNNRYDKGPLVGSAYIRYVILLAFQNRAVMAAFEEVVGE